VEQVLLHPDRARHGGDELLADGVQRRVGDLREQLDEVVVEQPGASGQRRRRGVGAHGPQRLRAGGRHRREHDPQLLLGVPEGLLAAHDRLVGVHHVLAVGQVVEVHEPGVQPLAVRLFGRELGLVGVVVDDAGGGPARPCPRVDEEHPARTQPALGDDLLRGDVEDAGLAREHHAVVGELPPARGAQAVAVEGGAHDGAVGEHHRRGAVPGLHEAGVEPVEVPLVGRHLGVVLPRLGDHHHHRVRQRAAAQREQFEDLVEARRVRDLLGAHRHRALQVPGEEVGAEQRLAGPHAVAVAADRVDLAVVRHRAVGVRQRPAREGVRREPAVHDGDRRLQPLVAQVREEQRQLIGGQHALVGHGAARQRGDVEPAALLARLPLGPLAHDVGDAVQLDAGEGPLGVREEDLGEPRHRRAGHGPDVGALRVGRHVPPAQDLEALLGGDALEQRDGLGVPVVVRGQEHHPGGVRVHRRPAVLARPGVGQRDVDRRAEQLVGELHQDARPVAAGGLTARGAAVVEVVQHLQGVGDDPVAATPLGVDDRTDTARVVLVRRVVEARSAGVGGEQHGGRLLEGRGNGAEPGPVHARTVRSSTRLGRHEPVVGDGAGLGPPRRVTGDDDGPGSADGGMGRTLTRELAGVTRNADVPRRRGESSPPGARTARARSVTRAEKTVG
jgi:hypothetical protein